MVKVGQMSNLNEMTPQITLQLWPCMPFCRFKQLWQCMPFCRFKQIANDISILHACSINKPTNVYLKFEKAGLQERENFDKIWPLKSCFVFANGYCLSDLYKNWHGHDS